MKNYQKKGDEYYNKLIKIIKESLDNGDITFEEINFNIFRDKAREYRQFIQLYIKNKNRKDPLGDLFK